MAADPSSTDANHPSFDILIVGGGFTGATLACALADGKRRILVLEAREGRGPRFAGELIHPTGVDVLDRLGLLAALTEAGGVPVDGFAISTADQPTAHLRYAEITGQRPHGFAMEHHDMVGVLRRAAAARPGVEVRYGRRARTLVREDGRVVGVRTEAGETIRAGLTLIAEGRHSALRHELATGESCRLVSYNAALLVAEAELPRSGRGHIFLGAPGPILAYPITAEKSGRQRIRMCFDLPELPAEGRGLQLLAATLREHYLPWVPEPLRQAAGVALGQQRPDVAACHAIATQRCVAPGVALVGEAGGCSHPITAAGMTVCLTDVSILAHEFARALEPEEVLAHYQARRYRFARAREELTLALYEAFQAKSDGTRALRAGMFRYWQGGSRARAASLALLSGADSRLVSFLAEYGCVAGHGMVCTMRHRVAGGDGQPIGRWRGLRGLMGKSAEKLQRVARRLRSAEL
jgi:2-polyprenyl-6-methoxyphenol hydroxylase-like FAD-dependent oxidoreductase